MTNRPTRVRHVVLWLTVAAYMITYMDRVVMSAAMPVIKDEFGLSLLAMSSVVFWFRWGYSLFQIPGGWLGDRIGPRRALALIVTWWSIFTSLTGAAWNLASMSVIRFLFGMGEAGAFPIATRSLSRWILPAERGFAQGVTHAGSRLGAAITPVLVVWLIIHFGWRFAFVIFGFLGVAWAALWYWYYRDSPADHPSVNASELELIRSSLGGVRSRTTQTVPWKAILSSRTLWVLSAMYFCYGYCYSVYLDWFPTYLKENRGFNLKEMGLYSSFPLLAGTVGDLLGGWLSDIWAKRSGNLTLARRGVAISGFLLAGASIIPATFTSNPYLCVFYTCFAFFGLEFTVGVSWAIPLDIGGDYAGSVSAVMNTCGNIGGAISPWLLAYLVGRSGWHAPFVVSAIFCGAAALLYLRIDSTKRIFADAPGPEKSVAGA